MKRAFAVFAAFASIVGHSWAQAPKTPDPAKEKRLEWFREAKYGLFIHWGLYAIPAGEWNGKRSLGLGEWVMLRSAVPVKECMTPRSGPCEAATRSMARISAMDSRW